MPASPAMPGLLLTFAATVLLIFVCVSVPTWDSIYFLKTDSIKYGVFGFTGSDTGIGYRFLSGQLGLDDGSTSDNINTSVINNLTKTLILHPIAAGLAGLALLFGMCGAGYHRAGTVFMAIFAALATMITLAAWVLDMVLFGIVRNRMRDQGINAEFGNALWLTLGALVALVLAFCAGACGVFGSYRKKRETTY